MILRLYSISCCILVLIVGIFFIFSIEKSKRPYGVINTLYTVIKKIIIVYVGLFTIYLIFMIIYGITNGDSFKKICFLIPALSFILFDIFILLEIIFERFDFLFSTINIIAFVIWVCSSILLCFSIGPEPYSAEKSIEKMHIETISILEFKEVPYTNVSGNRCYIKSTPSCAYYYEVATENNGTTTKEIDGLKNYVEKHESAEYSSNPHIDVYNVIETYIDWYDNEHKKVVSKEYFIYIPENSIFHEVE